ncbi:putative translocator [Salinibacterium xinjiangense]|uniref:Threonine/homoserine/homoserine lactone efflux protein n=1 Tax=Salinibacterium xinjiangense TaxID=386302 RepID=A0A2C8YF25_9MICO|nr:LysE family translocator [Salinibacterium xinjiangense]GGK96771.1 putative translocator [Salinibacterium xinjiangense]SOE48864.1 Threonine/homoserine/homoserine lactone efflux protein [Salinibacterium xinjiangense]
MAALALILLPGPSVLFVIGRSMSLGRKGGVLSVADNALSTLPAITAISLGVGAIVAESVVVFTVITFVGAAYLVYLGVQAIRHRGDHTRPAATVSKRPSVLRLLLEGFFVGVSNPKTIVFFLVILSQLVSYRTGAIPLQMAILGLIFFAIVIVVDSMWALAAGTARAWFARKPPRQSHISVGGGVMMIGLGGALALTGSKT